MLFQLVCTHVMCTLEGNVHTFGNTCSKKKKTLRKNKIYTEGNTVVVKVIIFKFKYTAV